MVEVNPRVAPPICKLLDFAKYAAEDQNAART
jgi:translation initiation factor IF-3